MGANQSSAETRSVSMDNPSPSGVIDVSEEVVQRLKLGISKARQEKQEVKNAETTTRILPASEPKQVITTPASVKKPATAPVELPKPSTPTTNTKTHAAEASILTMYPRLEGEPIITSIEMQRQKEIELRENDEMWRKRMSELERNLNKTNQVMEEEYNKTFESVRKRFENTTTLSPHPLPLPPCRELKAQVIACYRSNPGESLKCAEEVKMFINCVEVHRTKKLEEKQNPAAKGA